MQANFVLISCARACTCRQDACGHQLNQYSVPDWKNVIFDYDNETLFSVKLKENNVSVQWLDNNWHYFFDTQGFIPDKVKFVHTINKNFKAVWRKYSA
jgi:hypothetical protein